MIWVQGRLRRHKLEHLNAIQGPAMALCNKTQLLFGLGERDVENALTLANPFQQELQRKRRLAGAKTPFVRYIRLASRPPSRILSSSELPVDMRGTS